MNTVLDILQHIVSLLRSAQLPEWGYWSYLVLALLVAIEGPIVTLLGAAAASAGLMRPGLVFVAASLGNLTADTLWYSVGYIGKIEWLMRFGRRLGANQMHLERLQRGMHDHVAKILFAAKLSVSLVIPSLIAAGLVKAPWRRWFPALFSAECIWTGSLVLVGYYATEAIKRVEKGLEYFLLVAPVIFIIFMVIMARHVFRDMTGNHTQ